MNGKLSHLLNTLEKEEAVWYSYRYFCVTALVYRSIGERKNIPTSKIKTKNPISDIFRSFYKIHIRLMIHLTIKSLTCRMKNIIASPLGPKNDSNPLNFYFSYYITYWSNKNLPKKNQAEPIRIWFALQTLSLSSA